ncbi:uncharacterized protein LOC130647665 [Hydractinia symbiolongicarpus]|uniref:uncharacterized protein LOC130647665 n=1 Tax=Hydractinia symbiolongicarpus TaxID=13093 RepID=UPI00254A4CF3|nr:uncharacterized protein LOC130647665 [Hydractinia symbiolongicarpus]
MCGLYLRAIKFLFVYWLNTFMAVFIFFRRLCDKSYYCSCISFILHRKYIDVAARGNCRHPYVGHNLKPLNLEISRWRRISAVLKFTNVEIPGGLISCSKSKDYRRKTMEISSSSQKWCEV